EKLILTGEKSARYVNVNATIDGGTFLGGIYLVAFEKDGTFGTNPKYYGDVNITVNDGAIYGPLSLSYRRLGAFYGNCTLNLNGGELYRITEICGPKALGGTMTGTLNFGPEVNASAKVTGSETFDFQLCTAADPFVFYHDGMYYMTSTGGTSIGLACAANLSDLGSAAKTTIFKAPSTYKNAWSPEIHYFSDEEIGFGKGGWYMFLGLANTEDEDHSGQREYVLKCLDGDYLLGRWGNPLTGAVNEPLMIEFTYSNSQGTNYNDIFCAGMSILRVNGKVYMTFVSEIGRDTSAFHQTINIVTFKTPWEITGEPVKICEPTYDWEMNGYSTNGTKWWPKVVEGCSPVYGEDGSIYLMYTGSGYWTTWYALGYMKLVGTDPMNPASWQKNPTPILQRKSPLTSKTVNGCGHGSYFTDSEGKMWVCYHGYVGKNTDSGRFAFLEPIYVSNSGVSIGGAGINPPDAGHTQTEPLNSTPLAERAAGFDIMDEAPRFKSASLTLQNNIAINFKVRNFDSLRYTNVRVEFEMAGKTTVVNEGVQDNNLLVFSFKNLSPAFMTETVTAKLYATYDGQEYELDCKEYSIATYCYNQLATDAASQNTALRTMLVDLLNYGSESQLYTNRNTDKLANAQLTEAQRAWATQTVPTYTSVLSFSDAPDVEKAVWKSASLYMQDNIQIRFKLQAESVEGLNAVITLDGRTWTVPAESFNLVGGVYVISFDKLVATQLSEKVEITICEGVVPVSKTLTYSVETYAAKTEENEAHYAIVNAMMKYGNAAMVYVDSRK
ncbi:MAG: family 43 glycosylhydrolase, partial [Clostridia bacterium]|nr:family 43 glycosylhydrolase [Clostridia bacterium]